MKPWYQKQLLIFDFDGTLVDSSPFHHQAFIEILKPWQMSVNYNDIKGLKSLDALIFLFKKNEIHVTPSQMNELVSKKQDISRMLMKKELMLSPTIKNFLLNASVHHQLAVVSSGSKKTVSETLAYLGIIHLFKQLICAEDVLHAKPHPEGFLMALKKMNIQHSSALVFEDSEVGFLAAKAAGLHFIDVNHFDWEYGIENNHYHCDT